MRKVLCLLVFMGVFLIGCAEVQNKLTSFNKTYESKLSKDELYDNAMFYIGKTYVSAKFCVAYSDKPTGRIVFDGISVIRGVSASIRYIVKCANGKIYIEPCNIDASVWPEEADRFDKALRVNVDTMAAAITEKDVW